MVNKRPSLRQLAASLRLSPATVSLVLNGRQAKIGISAATSKRILDAALACGYLRRPRHAEQERRRRVVVLSPSIEWFNHHTSFFAGVYSQLQQLGGAAGIDLFLAEFPGDDRRDGAAFQELAHFNADGYLTHSIGIARFLKARRLPVILFQGGGEVPGIINIFCDDLDAGRQAAQLALEFGHRRAGMVFYPGAYAGKSPRAVGFRSAFTAGGGRLDGAACWEVPWDHAAMERQLIALWGKLAAPPTVLYCFADNFVFPAIRALAHHGVRVPQDISLIGTDDLYWGRLAQPAFTTVNLCEELFAAELVRGIDRLLAGDKPFRLAVPVKMVVRESLGRVGKVGAGKRRLKKLS